jgi:hypothetical protein
MVILYICAIVAALDIRYFLRTVNPLRDGLTGIDRIISQSDFLLLKEYVLSRLHCAL